jgi:hypothetical protein
MTGISSFLCMLVAILALLLGALSDDVRLPFLLGVMLFCLASSVGFFVATIGIYQRDPRAWWLAVALLLNWSLATAALLAWTVFRSVGHPIPFARSAGDGIVPVLCVVWFAAPLAILLWKRRHY